MHSIPDGRQQEPLLFLLTLFALLLCPLAVLERFLLKVSDSGLGFRAQIQNLGLGLRALSYGFRALGFSVQVFMV